MFHVRPEAGEYRNGFNVYPWKDRIYSIGIGFYWSTKKTSRLWDIRYSTHAGYVILAYRRIGVFPYKGLEIFEEDKAKEINDSYRERIYSFKAPVLYPR